MAIVTTDKPVNTYQLGQEGGVGFRHVERDGVHRFRVSDADEDAFRVTLDAHEADLSVVPPEPPEPVDRVAALEARLDEVAALAEKADATAQEVAAAAKPTR